MTDKLVKTPLSNFDLNDLLKDVNSELGERKSINIYTVPQMMRNPKKFKEDLVKNKYSILFIENPDSNIGHWVIIYTTKNRLNLFCSYGTCPYDLDPRLDKFLRNNFNDVRYNTFQYQKYGDNATCGRWAMMVLALRKVYGDKLSLEMINKIIKDLKKKTGDSFDSTVAQLINSNI